MGDVDAEVGEAFEEVSPDLPVGTGAEEGDNFVDVRTGICRCLKDFACVADAAAHCCDPAVVRGFLLRPR